jgi:hypothetical protein
MFLGVKTTGHLVGGRLRRITANEDAVVFQRTSFGRSIASFTFL